MYNICYQYALFQADKVIDPAGPSFIHDQTHFNQWFLDYNKKGRKPPIAFIDNDQYLLHSIVVEVENWVREILDQTLTCSVEDF